MKAVFIFAAAACYAQTVAVPSPAKPERAETVTAFREIRILGIPLFKITHKRVGAATGDPKRGPVMIPVPRNPVAESIQAIKGERK